ncbi:MAG: acetyl-CoA carboxylase biotin carboxylase subunit [Thermoplasmata archaeon]|nr:acetyl-CoA carboxylase biotin carboxylase subunit [Thermoplasmata archaeon]
MIEKVLVANRGEIAVRVLRACKQLDIPTVAVYSEADKTALFTKLASEAYLLGPPSALESYLNIDKIIEIAVKSDVAAIHPGYGFLAENHNFANKCEEHGIIFIGPPGDVIEAMGDKISSKNTMRAAKVPVIPAGETSVNDVEKGKDIAHELGYPVIVKASAGGGGIGMTIVDGEDKLEKALETSQRVAEATFGDGTVFVEKYLDEPKHIEFQVLADNHGNVIHLRERECSIQRRFQKLIEESPSCIMTDELRERMGDAAVRAAQAIGYRNAGTVEFVYSKGDFYFLEMNTRLQVEHPITEMVTGIDLVIEQLKITSGNELQYTQEDIKGKGWAIECRINAEDPMNQFFPSPGKITEYQEPTGLGIRVDSGVFKGFEVTPYYDSLLAKLIIWGRNREQALNRMENALKDYNIGGISTNIPMHVTILKNDSFKAGEYTTHFIQEHNILDAVQKRMSKK